MRPAAHVPRPDRPRHTNRRCAPIAFGGLLLTLTPGCGPNPGRTVAVEGETVRTIGETVKLELLVGSPGFSGGLTIVDAAGTTFDAAALQITLEDERTLTFVIPPGMAAGRAQLRVTKAGEDGTAESDAAAAYELGLDILRFAAVAGDSGDVRMVPLPPSTLEPVSVHAGDAPPLISISPDGGLLVTASAGELTFFRLARSPRELSKLSVADVTAIAALPDGALVGTPTNVVVVHLGAGDIAAAQATIPIKATKALAVGGDATKAVALHACVDTDDRPIADCAAQIDLTATPATVGASVQLDSTPSATVVAAGRHGAVAVVPDADAVYGITFERSQRLSLLGWDLPPTWQAPAEPRAIAATVALIGGALTDLFAIFDGRARQIRTVGFAQLETDPSMPLVLKDLTQHPLSLETATAALAFGHEADLYLGAEGVLLEADMTQGSPQTTELPVGQLGKIRALAVQP